MKNLKCIFCDVGSGHVVIEENGYKGLKCPECGLIYTSPRPSSGAVVNLYGHDDAHISAESHIASEFSKRLYARHHLKLIRSFCVDGSVLEVGAGAGYFLDEARKVGFDPCGIEFNPAQASFIRNELHIPCEEAPLNSSLFNAKKFNLVYHSDVVSHFADPIADFRKMHEMMNDDGIMVFETGNLGEVDETYFSSFQRFQYPDHLFFFNTKNIKCLLERTDFQLLRIFRYSILPQLTAIRISSGIKRALGRKPSGNVVRDERSSARTSNEKGRGGVPKLANSEPRRKGSVGNLVNYWLRYKVGKVAPKARRPQTMLIVAKKGT